MPILNGVDTAATCAESPAIRDSNEPMRVPLLATAAWVVVIRDSATSRSACAVVTRPSTAVTREVAEVMPDSAAFRGVSVQNLMNPKTLEYPETGDSGPGTEGANLSPTQASGLIRFRAPLAGRRYRGRIYPGLISAGLIAANGGLSVGGETALNALATELGPARTVAEDGQTALLALAIRHPDAIVVGVRVPQWTLVDLINPSVLLATQKRRGEYGQHNTIPW